MVSPPRFIVKIAASLPLSLSTAVVPMVIASRGAAWGGAWVWVSRAFMGGNVLLRLMANRLGLAPHGITEPVLAFALMAAVHPSRLSVCTHPPSTRPISYTRFVLSRPL